MDDVVALTALIQCLVKKLSDQIDEGTYQHDCHPMMVRQNKWRACRFGVNAQLVDSYTYKVVSVSEMTRALIERLGPTAQDLGCLEHLERVQDIADGESLPDKQRSILDATGEPAEIVRQIMRRSRISKIV
ncbi:MAG: carboxylate-amine ligase [Pirellulaceae bacterium]